MAVRLRQEDGPDLIIEATLRDVAATLGAASRAGQTLKIDTPEGTLEVVPERVTALEAWPEEPEEEARSAERVEPAPTG